MGSRQESTQIVSLQDDNENVMNNLKSSADHTFILSTANATAVQSCEKINEVSQIASEKTVSVGPASVFKAHCNGEFSKSMLRPKESVGLSSHLPFSSSKRPKNELGLRD